MTQFNLFSNGVRKALIIFSVGVAMLVVYGIANLTQYIQDVKNEHSRQTQQKAKEKADAIEKALVKYVYTHSDKISQKTSLLIVQSAMKTDKPLLMLAVISVESEFNPASVSTKGAKGLTQVMWKVWAEPLKKAGIAKEERDLFDIDVSIRAGDLVLDECFRQNGDDISKVLSCYLGGREQWYKNRITEHLANLYLITRGIK